MQLTTEEMEVINSIHYRPAISMLLSFTPAMGKEVTHRLKLAADQVERRITETYPGNITAPVLEKLRQAIGAVDLAKVKKSLAIFVSPLLSKTFYIDLPLEEKLVIDESFEVRDLIYAKQESLQYLILLITGRHAKAFMADNGSMIRLNMGIAENIEAFDNDVPERVFNFSDPGKRKEQLQDKFLRGVDDSLSEILKSHNMPVFLIGVERLVGHFKNVSNNLKSIIAAIHGNFENATLPELKSVLEPSINEWKESINQELIAEIEKAANAGQLVTGIQNVWEYVTNNNGRLLIVEKNFMYPAEQINKQQIRGYEDTNDVVLNIKDAVDDIIEMVIKGGGEVRFAPSGMLSKQQQIALITYY